MDDEGVVRTDIGLEPALEDLVEMVQRLMYHAAVGRAAVGVSLPVVEHEERDEGDGKGAGGGERYPPTGKAEQSRT